MSMVQGPPGTGKTTAAIEVALRGQLRLCPLQPALAMRSIHLRPRKPRAPKRGQPRMACRSLADRATPHGLRQPRRSNDLRRPPHDLQQPHG